MTSIISMLLLFDFFKTYFQLILHYHHSFFLNNFLFCSFRILVFYNEYTFYLLVINIYASHKLFTPLM